MGISKKATYNFFTFGHFMGMNIVDVTSESKFGELDGIFNDRLSTKNEEDLNTQTYYTFREVTEELIKFWNSMSNAKYVIVSFVHVTENKGMEKEIRKEIDDLINQSNDLEGYTYSTFNNCDFIVFSQTKNYDAAIKQLLKIDGMKINNNKANISYSYTVLSVPVLSMKNKIAEYTEVFSSLTIKFMAKNMKKLIEHLNTISIKNSQKVNQDFKDNMKIILGSDDITVHLHDIVVKDYLSLFLNNGTLSMGNRNFAESTNSLSTHIELDNKFYTEGNDLEKGKDAVSWIDDQIFLIMQLYKRYFDKGGISQKECFYGILHILHYMKQFKNDSIDSYAYACVGYALKMYIERIRSFLSLSPNQLSSVNVEDLYSALECMNTIMQGFADSYIHVFQRPVYIPSLYNISGKLISFYSGIMFFLTFLLRSIDQELDENQYNHYHYAFLLDVKFHNVMSVEIVFSDQNPCDRLLLMKTPVYQIYNPTNFIISLAHEVSHVVGDNLRMRKKRNEYVKKLLVDAIAQDIINALKEESFPINEEELLEEIRAFFETELNNYIGRYANNVYIDHSKYFNDYLYQGLRYASTAKREELYRLLHDFCLKELVKDESFVVYNCEELAKREKLINFLENIKEYIYSNLYLKLTPPLLDLGQTIEYLTTLFNECYADLVAVFLLNPDFKDYIASFRFNEQGSSNIINDDIQVILRISCICSVYYRKQDEKFNLANVEIDESYKDLLESVKRVINEEDFSDIQGFIKVKDAYPLLTDYLQSCLNQFQSKEENHQTLIKDFKSLYGASATHCNKGSSLDKFYEYIDKINKCYQDYHKAALLYYFELEELWKNTFDADEKKEEPDGKEELDGKEKEKEHYYVQLTGRKCRYLPLYGRCYCILNDDLVYKVFIENVEYTEKDKFEEKIVKFTILEKCNDAEKSQVLNLKKLQVELETGSFSLGLNEDK